MIDIQWIAVTAIKPNVRNARIHSKKQIRQIAESITAFGFLVPILVDETGTVIAGHGRYEAAVLLGLQAIPTIRVPDLSEAKRRALAIADNKIAENAGWDRNILMAELAELSVILPELDLSVDLTGFNTGEIDVLLADAAEEQAASQDDEIGEAPPTTTSRPGDMWLLGRHRIVCGDARNPALLHRLMPDERADMVFTDPPYNVPVQGHVMGNGRTMHPDFAMAFGEMSEEQFTSFLRDLLKNTVDVSRDGALHYVCMDWRHIANLIEAGKPIYSELKNLCVWAKTNGGQGSLYRSQHELVAVFKVGEAEHVNNVELGRHGRNRSNVWHYAGVNSFKPGRLEELAAHPTVKPVALVADAIKDVTCRNAIVFDPCGGSGTTMIAAERTGRRARLIEIEPRYVDVTVRRYQALTKADAIYSETRETFDQVAVNRMLTPHSQI